MAARTPIPISPFSIDPKSEELDAILNWPFPDQPFYKAQIKRLLQDDIPQRVVFSNCQVWGYRDPEGKTVGFGTLDLCHEYKRFTNGKAHCYLPVLAVHPDFEGRGHGRSIVQHLILAAELALTLRGPEHCSEYFFLDVYTANQRAISLYEKFKFGILSPPIQDPDENNETYVVMAKKLVVQDEFMKPT
jgi:ribosomal protein S18 acetylase RimI-like enzyme